MISRFMRAIGASPVRTAARPIDVEACTLRDGREIVMRPVRQGDARAVHAFLAALDPDDYRKRFPVRIVGGEMPVVDGVTPEKFVSLLMHGVIDASIAIDAKSEHVVGLIDSSESLLSTFLSPLRLVPKTIEPNIAIRRDYQASGAAGRLVRYSMRQWEADGFKRLELVRQAESGVLQCRNLAIGGRGRSHSAPTVDDRMPGSA